MMMESDIITCTRVIYRWVDTGTAMYGEWNLCLLQRSNPSHGGKEGKPHEPHFELEATSFPPLPGSTVSTWGGVVGFTTWMVVLWLQHVLLGWLPEWWYYGCSMCCWGDCLNGGIMAAACVVGVTTWMVVLWLQHVLLGWLPEWWYYGCSMCCWGDYLNGGIMAAACVVGVTAWMVVFLWLQHVLLGWLPEWWSSYGCSMCCWGDCLNGGLLIAAACVVGVTA